MLVFLRNLLEKLSDKSQKNLFFFHNIYKMITRKKEGVKVTVLPRHVGGKFHLRWTEG